MAGTTSADRFGVGAARLPITHVVLLGLMGAGKSTVGRALGEGLGWRVSDSDSEIGRSTGQTAVELVTARGKEHLHALERQHLLNGLAGPGLVVVCAAASVIDELACRDAMGAPSVCCVWLRASVATLVERFASGGHRPRYHDDLPQMFRAQMQARHAHLAAVSVVCVDVDGRSADDIADEVLGAISSRREGQGGRTSA